MALVLQDQGKYEEAEQMNRQALEEREKALGKSTQTRWRASATVAGAAIPGRYEEAEQMNRQALEGSEKALGKSTQHADQCVLSCIPLPPAEAIRYCV